MPEILNANRASGTIPGAPASEPDPRPPADPSVVGTIAAADLRVRPDIRDGLLRVLIPPSVITGATNGAALDMGLPGGPCIVNLGVGALTASATVTFLVQQSANGSTGWATITGGNPAAIPTAAVPTSVSLSLTRTQRYMRVVATPAGTDVSANVGATVMS